MGEGVCLGLGWVMPHLGGRVAVRLAVAGGVFGGVLFCAVLFPTRCLG